MPIEDMPVWLDAMSQNRQQMEEGRDPRAGWGSGDWDRALRNALQVQSRHGANPGEWEYLVQGDWVNQATYNDPRWQENVFAPWQQSVRDEWDMAYEGAAKWNRENEGRGGFFEEERKPQGRQRSRGRPMRSASGDRRSGGSSVGSSSSRRRYDPAMIAQLIGG